MTLLQTKRKLASAIPRNCNECIQPCALLKGCDVDVKNHFSLHKTNYAFLGNQKIAPGIYIIKKGAVKIVKTDSKNQGIIHIAFSGDIIGLNQALTVTFNDVDAIALEDSMLCGIHTDTFSSLLDQHPELMRNALEYSCTLLAEYGNKLAKMMHMNVRTRVADALLMLYKISAQQDESNTQANQVEINLSRIDIARLTGTTKEQVSKALGEFKSLRIITTKGRRIKILEYGELKAFVEN